jgi:hypothetical protein
VVLEHMLRRTVTELEAKRDTTFEHIYRMSAPEGEKRKEETAKEAYEAAVDTWNAEVTALKEANPSVPETDLKLPPKPEEPPKPDPDALIAPTPMQIAAPNVELSRRDWPLFMQRATKSVLVLMV